MVFVGIDWAMAHHDVCVVGELARCSLNGGWPTACKT